MWLRWGCENQIGKSQPKPPRYCQAFTKLSTTRQQAVVNVKSTMTSRQINIPSTTPELTDIWPLESLLSLDIHKVIVMSKPKTMEGIELQIEQKPGHSATLWSEVCPGSESIFGIGNFNCNLWIPAKIKGRYEILFEFMLRGHRIDKTTTFCWRVHHFLF